MPDSISDPIADPVSGPICNADAFAALRAETQTQSPLRAAVSAARFVGERERVAALLAEAPTASEAAEALAGFLVRKLRAHRPGPVEALMRAFPIGTPAGLALMSLAEALPRIPDATTRQAMIEEMLSSVDWNALGAEGGRFGLRRVIAEAVGTGRAASDMLPGAKAALRVGLSAAIGRIGRHFIAGATIESALRHAARREALGYRHSFDMLGEAAVCEADAARYLDLYQNAIHAVGAAASDGLVARFADRPVEGPGVSVKLSALHPRFVRAQRATVMSVLLQRLTGLARLAARYDIGLTIDAEEVDRLDLTHDLFEALCADEVTRDWHGLGIVVQAYQRAAPELIDHLVDLAQRSGRRLMVRLVKGAYWDSEIKRAQLAGLADFALFTRKEHTDLSYLVCAQRLLAAGGAVYPQFATHNAQTVAAIWRMAGGPEAPRTAYEFQCLHGMGEPLYDEVVPPDRLYRPARIYAPVGGHDALLAYLVRRLLENGANSAFVNRIADPQTSEAELTRAPQARIAAADEPGAPSPFVVAPDALFGPRRNAAGLDLAHEPTLHRLAESLAGCELPLVDDGEGARVIAEPADPSRRLGRVADTTPASVAAAFEAAPASGWAATAAERAEVLRGAADRLEAQITGAAPPVLLALVVREAGRTLPDAIGELREAIDFLRYYADAAGLDAGPGSTPLGRVVCISPWNFPVAIFVGQIAAALAAGNAVLAKPAVQTPLCGLAAGALLHAAGVPRDVLGVLPGDAATGQALTADPRCDGVMFTGSTTVGRQIAITLAGRLAADGRPVPLIAETGGQNAIVVDSSALPEQVAIDVLTSAFNSAGQRCSAARILCLPTATAEHVLGLLRGAMSALRLGPPERLSSDIGPMISAAAVDRVAAHVGRLHGWGRPVYTAPFAPSGGHFLSPTLIEIASVEEIGAEVFGPVLHVVRYGEGELESLVDRIAALGYGLTFGVQSRLRERAAALVERSGAGNAYVNRNTIGAVVGAQPFGGHGLSGTGPKAGGPLILRRLMAHAPAAPRLPRAKSLPGAFVIWRSWLHGNKFVELTDGQEQTALGAAETLPAPVGERNVYRLVPRGAGLCLATDRAGLYRQIGAVLAAGSRAIVTEDDAQRLGGLDRLSVFLDGEIRRMSRKAAFAAADFALVEPGTPWQTLQELATGAHRIVPLFAPDDTGHYPGELLVSERSESINTAAIGGDVTLLSLA
ncbi:RHH-type proline utilization regulon transcriptional repressor/proline dehydrogenase/delta 1-pyrroline-5-carboxylate dehydrogenase [Endobacter medicaginis]|uniref:Bifunctional protein PutA n=3 Tax=Endobacter medicaginis TaxID=1181271 RepID=A0A839V2P5_9PROT|nr:bifunctional proline dehydrogenase/L-glutamate gamma-semialdehyde dehydrogenase PutA [Endobacter medicaginis]MBB3174780.1 RHH-type proline utilization regulon transcriptional repressor/proline dehydrogenase/delta 1-pyrroline-5-carboxylate dehydrogenase [Endobacter medicaginis]MCX5475840.1 bifunctional proline dehydrogenase/L-glutamate gamma-semialdehyde dehydrogenase PutA [Endobacter medicaginis]